MDSSGADFGTTQARFPLLQRRNIEYYWIESTLGQLSVAGVAYRSGGGKSLVFNGYIGTVTFLGRNGLTLSFPMMGISMTNSSSV
jgi:hypothetical protein